MEGLLIIAVGWLLDLIGKRGRGGRGNGQAMPQEVKTIKVETPPTTSTGKTPVTVIPAKGVE